MRLSIFGVKIFRIKPSLRYLKNFKTLLSVVFLALIAGAAVLYFVAGSPQSSGTLGSFNNAVSEFEVRYDLLQDGAKNHPKGKEILARIQENEKKLKDDDTANDRETYELLAFDVRQLGDNAGAVLGYRASIALLHNNIFAFNNLAVSYQELGQYEKAEAAYKEILKISPGEVQAYRNLADLYLYSLTNKEGRIPGLINEGLQRVPEHADLLSYIAVYYQNKGEKDKAIYYYERLLRVMPTNTAAVRELNSLLTK